jgi:hypothetical protein
LHRNILPYLLSRIPNIKRTGLNRFTTNSCKQPPVKTGGIARPPAAAVFIHQLKLVVLNSEK